jgi:hypothetical protein
MPTLTGKSAGVSTREIDLSQPTTISPRGVPAGVIGTAVRGPAFVPVTFATFQDFVSNFGNTDGKKFGPLAVNEWMKNSTAGTFIRLLGVGDGKKKDSDGVVTNAGFTAGQQLTQDDGLIGLNTYAQPTANSSGTLGRTFFLGCFMSESAGSTIFSEAGIQDPNRDGAPGRARPIIRGVIFTPSGVVASLSSSQVANNTAPSFVAGANFGPGEMAGANWGDVITGSSQQQFVMFLNGHKTAGSYHNTITASFDSSTSNYFGSVLNKDPLLIEQAGHYLYTSYAIDPVYAQITGSGMALTPAGSRPGGAGGDRATLGFLLTGSGPRASGGAADASNVGKPDFESFTDRFTVAKSPFVVSQKFGGRNQNLFRVLARDHGAAGSTTCKITIENIQGKKSGDIDKFGTFNLLVRKFDDVDEDRMVLETHFGLSLNPSSDRYVTRVIGDTNAYYDFDRNKGSQKLIIEGKYPNNSPYIRIEESDDLRLGRLDATALPSGFRGLPHLITSGTSTDGSILTGSSLSGDAITKITSAIVSQVVQLPVPFRESVSKGRGVKRLVETDLTWGVQFEKKISLAEPNISQAFNTDTLISFTKYFPDFHITNQNVIVSNNEGTATLAGSVLDADLFNNNLFTLERIEVITSSNDVPHPLQWAVAAYRRNGVLSGSMANRDDTFEPSRFLDPAKDFSDGPAQKYLKFTFPLHGGFDGLNVFNDDKVKMTDNAIRREMADTTNESGVNSATVASVRKAIDVMEEKSDVDIQLLAMPGYRHVNITDYAIDSVERRFDALFIMDIEEKDNVDSYITASVQQEILNVGNTVNRFTSRALDSSFAAAYFPDVVMTDPSTNTNVQCPPSVAVLGAFALNDTIAHPWFAPAGFTRGALKSVVESNVKLNRNNLDDLYTADINPVTSLTSTSGVVVFGQKTLLSAQSALDRVNVRRLLIDVRRKVRSVANSLLFEPNREDTLSRFSSAVTPILTRIQQQQGLDRFKVQIDTSTTTQADVENNTIRGKIFLQPTRTVEFISLDFVVTNAGAGV